MYTLLIIDMQPEFKASEKCLPEVLHLITKAKKDKANILVVDYVGSGFTWFPIRKELKGYEHTITIKKKNDDGGPEVFRALKIMNWLNLPIFTCGVNSNFCVKDTLNGLNLAFKYDEVKSPGIFVVTKACNHEFKWSWQPNVFSGYPQGTIKLKDDVFSIKFDLKTCLKLLKTRK